MIIVPAVLSDKIEDYEKAFALFDTFPDIIKVDTDVMDGRFVDTISPDLESIVRIPTKFSKQVDLMVQEPFEYISICQKYEVKEVGIHFGASVPDFRDLLRYSGMSFIININPDISVEQIKPYLEFFSGALIMTVVPGRQGQTFLPENLEKINELKQIGFQGKIIVDGGVNQTTIDQVLKYPVDEVVVGSGIIKQEDPLEAYLEFQKRIFK